MSVSDREARLTGPGGAFEIAERSCGGGPSFKAYATSPHTLGDVFSRAARAFRLRPLITQCGATVTYGEFFARTKAVSDVLKRARGFRRGVRVALVAEDSAERLVALTAIIASGGVCVSLHPREEASRRSQALRMTACEIGIVDAAGAHVACPVLSELPTVRLPVDAEARPDLDARDWIVAADPRDEALIVFTSGSTGAPKAALLDHEGVMTGLKNMLLGGALASLRNSSGGTPGASAPAPPCNLSLGSLGHVSGHSQFLLMMMVGGRLVLPPPSMGDVANIVRQESVRSVSGLSGGHFRDLIQAARSGGEFPSLASLSLHGGAFTPELFRELRRLFPHVSLGASYGMTETNGAVAVAATADLERRPGSSGQLLPTVQAKVVDDAGRLQGPGDPGTIWLRGPMMMRGYLQSDGRLRTSPDEGWFCTGDVGWIDDDRFIYVTSRADALLRTRIERAAEACSGVAEAVALFPDDGKVVVYCSLHSGARRPGDVVARIQDDLGPSDWRPEVRFSDCLPRTLSGKVDRQALLSRLTVSVR